MCYDASHEMNKPKLNRLSVQVNHHTLSLDITIYRCVVLDPVEQYLIFHACNWAEEINTKEMLML